MNYISDYLNTRRVSWPYDGRYTVDRFGENGFVAKIDGNVAGLAWADVTDGEAVMHMNFKPDYKEYGIGTELLHKLMNHLIEFGCRVVRYSISVEYWAYQIYENLGFEIEIRNRLYMVYKDATIALITKNKSVIIALLYLQ